MEEKKIIQSRENCLTRKMVVVDGQPGCGKTLFSSIMASLERVELMTYAFHLEWISRSHFLGNITDSAAVALTKLCVDLQLYQNMMGREMNFRPGDLSSALRTRNPWKYLARLLREGDMKVPEQIEKEKPVLNLTTHNLLAFPVPFFQAFARETVFVEVVRHPLYMIKQLALNMERLPNNPRDCDVYYSYRNFSLPYYAKGWEEEFINGNPVEKAVGCIASMTRQIDDMRKKCLRDYDAVIITVPFEKFVFDPLPFISKITEKLGSSVTKSTRKEMKKQKVPRKMIADGLKSSIYQRCGWKSPQTDSEIEELKIRRNFAKRTAVKDAMRTLDALCENYEETYLDQKLVGQYA